VFQVVSFTLTLPFCSPLCPPLQYRPSQDQANAAQSGAMVMNLEHELTYLRSFLSSHKGIDMQKDWKLMHLLIGANDMCYICIPELEKAVFTADKYEEKIRSLLQHIKETIPRTIVNMIHLFPVSGIHTLTKKDPHCKQLRSIPGFRLECSCAFMPEPLGLVTRRKMDSMTEQYNQRLKRIVDDFQASARPEDQFAVTSDEAFWNVPVTQFPIEGISDIDCFHPSRLLHQNMASTFW
jgi:phospholipase B1